MSGLGKIGAAGALVACLLILSACGSGGNDATIPKTDADNLLAQLSQVQDAITSGDCATASANAAEFVNAVDALPANTGADTKAELRAAGENLENLTKSQCQSGPTGPSGPKSTSPTTAPPTTTTPTTTETTTTSTTTTAKPPPQNGGGQGGGNNIGGGTGGTGGTDGGKGG